MDSFKLFLESDLNGLVHNMVTNRFSKTERLVTADWLDEHDSPALAEYVRYVDQISTGREKNNYEKFKKIQQAALLEILRLGIKIDDPQSTVPNFVRDGKRYRLGFNSIQELNSKNQWVSVKKVDELPEDVAKGIIFAILNKSFHAADIKNPTDLDEPRQTFKESLGELGRLANQIRIRWQDPRVQLEIAVINRFGNAAEELVKSLEHVDSDFLRNGRTMFSGRLYSDEFLTIYSDLMERYRRREMIAARQPYERLKKSLDEALKIFNSKLRS